MFSKSLLASASLCLLLAPYAAHAAVVSLYIPLGDPSIAFSADVLGVDDTGHTTWRVSPGTPSGTLTSVAFPAVTLIEGPNDAQAIVPEDDGSVLLANCGIDSKEGLSTCTVALSASGAVQTVLVGTETVRDNTVPVQVTGIPTANGAGVTSTGSAAAVFLGVVYGLIML